MCLATYDLGSSGRPISFGMSFTIYKAPQDYEGLLKPLLVSSRARNQRNQPHQEFTHIQARPQSNPVFEISPSFNREYLG